MVKFNVTLCACLMFISVLAFGSAARSKDETDTDDDESEMKLTPEQLKQLTTHIPNRPSDEGSQSAIPIWPAATLYYEYTPGHFSSEHKRVIQEAMDEITKYTCLKFKLKQASDYNYIKFQDGNGCSSYVGKSHPGQALTLSHGCRHRSTVVHELLHAAGFIHEQSQSNRDTYVKIHLQNIKANKEGNFHRYQPYTYNRRGVAYSYDSVMHYASKAFSSNGQPTITTVPGGKEDHLGQRSGIGYTDVHMTNKVYRCAKTCGAESMCTYNGVQGHFDKNCKCICEDGSQDCDRQKAIAKDSSCTNSYRNDWECARRAGDGKCQHDATWMAKNCKKACNLCSGTGTGTAGPGTVCRSTNMVGDTDCNSYAAQGDCHNQWLGWMNDNCAKACDEDCKGQ